MTAALNFAHPRDVRQAGRDALLQHKSYRKASAVTGIPRSTLHLWATRGGFDDLPQPALSQLDLPGENGIDDPQTPEEDAASRSAELGSDLGFDLNNSGEVGAPTASAGYPVDPDAWYPDSPDTLEAFWRYASGLANGAPPHHAMRVAQMIDPAFELSPPQDIALLRTLTSMTMSETLRLAQTDAPAYVRAVFDDYSWGDAEVNDLADIIASIRTAAASKAIDDQLVVLGRAADAKVTDPGLLAQIASDAQSSAQGIADTYNRELASRVGQLWLDLAAEHGRQTSQIKLAEATQAWLDDREAWKADQIAMSESSRAYTDVVHEFHSRNGTGQRVRMDPDTGCEELCQPLCDLGWVDADSDDGQTMGNQHPNCVLGDTRIRTIGRVRAASRAFYAGPVVTVQTASGQRVTASPNHPILTGRGWLAAEHVRQGDDVLHVLSADEAAHAIEGPGIDLDEVPTAEQVFASLLSIGHRRRSVSAASDFHGDGIGIEGEIEVVDVVRPLSRDGDTHLVEVLGHLPLMGTAGCSMCRESLQGQGAHDLLAVCGHATARRGVGGANLGRVGVTRAEADARLDQPFTNRLLRAPLVAGDGRRRQAVLVEADVVDGHALPRQVRAQGAAVHDDPGPDEAAPDRHRAGADVLRHLGEAHGLRVESDEVIGVQVRAHRGFVFDFETGSGAYTAGSLVVHNCVHVPEYETVDVPADAELWTGGTSNAEAAAVA